MNFHTLLRVFLKWFLIGQGIIWSFLTLYITLTGIRVQGQGIAFAWVIAILFGLLMSFISNVLSTGSPETDDVKLFD